MRSKNKVFSPVLYIVIEYLCKCQVPLLPLEGKFIHVLTCAQKRGYTQETVSSSPRDLLPFIL